MRKENFPRFGNDHTLMTFVSVRKEKLAYSFVIAVAPSADASADPHQELVNRILQVTIFL